MEKYKSKLKSELAQAAGVSLPTFRRWLLSEQQIAAYKMVHVNVLSQTDTPAHRR